MNIRRDFPYPVKILDIWIPMDDGARLWLPEREDEKEDSMTVCVSHLKKISLSVRAAAGAAEKSSATEQAFSFIFGVSGSGLCPFEVQMEGRALGEKVQLNVPRAEMAEYFGHLWVPLVQALNLQIMPAQLCLEIKLTGIDEPARKEIVQAMAASLGGDCGCGCGGCR